MRRRDSRHGPEPHRRLISRRCPACGAPSSTHSLSPSLPLSLFLSFPLSLFSLPTRLYSSLLETPITLLLALVCLQAADDPAPVTAPITSWYRLERRNGKDWEHVGYACEKLIPVGGKPWTFDYAYDFAFIMARGEERLAGGRFMVTAQLDKHCEAQTIDGFLSLREGGGRSIKMTTLDDARVLELVTGDQKFRIKKSLDDPATPVPSLMLYSAFRTKNLDDKTPLRFIDAWAKDALVTLTATVSKPEKRQVLDRPVTVVDVEIKNMSAIFPELPAFTRFTLDRFGRIVQAETGDGNERLLLVAGEDDAIRGDKMLKESNRRDPFAKKDVPTIDVVITPGARIISVADSLKRAAALLTSLRDAALAGREKAAEEHYTALVALYKELWPRAQALDQSKLEKIRVDAEGVHGGVKRVVRYANALHDTINDYVEALSMAKAAEKLALLKSLEDSPALWRQAERAEISTLIASASAALDRGHATIELNKKKLVLSGMMIADAKNTYAVINDQSVRVGDIVDGVKVEKITRDLVTVSLNGVKRDLTLSK